MRLLLVIPLFAFISCKNNVKAPVPIVLEGNWNLYSATRDGKKTGTLENSFMQFDKDSIRTNMYGRDMVSHYTREGSIISQHFPALVRYTIDSYSPDSMQLSCMLEGSEFKLKLNKKQ